MEERRLLMEREVRLREDNALEMLTDAVGSSKEENEVG